MLSGFIRGKIQSLLLAGAPASKELKMSLHLISWNFLRNAPTTILYWGGLECYSLYQQIPSSRIFNGFFISHAKTL